MTRECRGYRVWGTRHVALCRGSGPCIRGMQKRVPKNTFFPFFAASLRPDNAAPQLAAAQSGRIASPGDGQSTRRRKMAEQIDKARILNEMRTNYAALEKILEPLDKTQMTTEGVIP